LIHGRIARKHWRDCGKRFITATLSNAGMAAVTAVVKHAGLPFDAILTAELTRSYKPALGRLPARRGLSWLSAR
jgi:FMN phosphatase YigB (HAD superfamily)